jgi:class 3 adenylate cyclase
VHTLATSPQPHIESAKPRPSLCSAVLNSSDFRAFSRVPPRGFHPETRLVTACSVPVPVPTLPRQCHRHIEAVLALPVGAELIGLYRQFVSTALPIGRFPKKQCEAAVRQRPFPGSDRLQALLDRLGLIEYADIFRKEKIDDGNLHLLTEAYLREINIPLGPALQIMDALRGSRPTQVGSSLASWPLPPSVGVQFATSEDLRQITVLYCDLVQSTELTRRLGYERYATFFAEYLSTCAQIVAQHDQEISELKGDGIGIYFGLRKAREDDVDQAVRAAIEISQAVSKIPTTEESNACCRIGIATGAVAVTNSQVFGDVMNLASRLPASWRTWRRHPGRLNR